MKSSNPFYRPPGRRIFRMFGNPQPATINPHEQDTSVRCPLCRLTFDSGAQLRLELKKDGYGDCSFCPQCGQKLKEFVDMEAAHE